VAGVGAGVFFLVSWRRWEALAAAGGAVAVAAAVFSWNVGRCAAEAERFFRRSPDTVFDQADMPIGELVKITGVSVPRHILLIILYQIHYRFADLGISFSVVLDHSLILNQIVLPCFVRSCKNSHDFVKLID
jgi:hypothetical protein